jgi:hypothetical protein
MGNLLKAAYATISGWVTRASPEVLAAIAKRVGMAGKLTGERLVSMAKDNKVMTAMVLFEMGEEGAELLGKLADADPEVRHLVSLFGQKNDLPDDSTSVTEIGKYTDEFHAISAAIRQFGSLERFMVVRRALAMPEEIIRLYLQVRDVSHSL